MTETNDRHDIRMVAIDLDGTLLAGDKTISDRNSDAIEACREKGVQVVIASARPPRSVRPFYESLDLNTLQINYNGALIYDMPNNQPFYHKPLDADVVERIIHSARSAYPDCHVSLEVLDEWLTDAIDESMPTETSKLFGPNRIAPISDLLSDPVSIFMLMAPTDRIKTVQDAVDDFTHEVEYTTSDEYMLQIHHPDAGKVRAVEIVAEHYGVDWSNVMAIGDAPNDEGMIQQARLGVAVANAWPQTADAADVVVSSNDQDGVAEALERYVL